MCAARSSLNCYSEASQHSAFVSGAKKFCIYCYFQNLLWEKHTFLTLFPFSLGAEQYFRRIPEASGFKILVRLLSLGNYVKYSCYYKYLGLVVGFFFFPLNSIYYHNIFSIICALKKLSSDRKYRTSYLSFSSLFDLQTDFTHSAHICPLSDLSCSIENRQGGTSNSALPHAIREHSLETAPCFGCCCMRHKDRRLKLEIIPRRQQRDFNIWGKINFIAIDKQLRDLCEQYSAC